VQMLLISFLLKFLPFNISRQIFGKQFYLEKSEKIINNCERKRNCITYEIHDPGILEDAVHVLRHQMFRHKGFRESIVVHC
jgi:hypothetical protein